MQSVLSLLATAWFILAALLIGDGSDGVIGEPPNQEAIGDPAKMAIHLVARVLFVGLAILALAFVEWERLRAAESPYPADVEGSSGSTPSAG